MFVYFRDNSFLFFSPSAPTRGVPGHLVDFIQEHTLDTETMFVCEWGIRTTCVSGPLLRMAYPSSLRYTASCNNSVSHELTVYSNEYKMCN